MVRALGHKATAWLDRSAVRVHGELIGSPEDFENRLDAPQSSASGAPPIFILYRRSSEAR